MTAMEVDSGPTTKVEEKWYPRFDLAQLRAAYERTKDQNTLNQIIVIVKEERMLPYYQKMCEQLRLKVDLNFVQELQKEQDATEKAFGTSLADAEENAGDIEVKNCLLDRAEFLNRVGDKEKALEAYEKAYEKTVGSGGKLDNILVRVRICLFFDDLPGVKKFVALAHEELKKGGDWERKNKLKVLEGMYKVMIRDWEGAANLLLEAVATFTAAEVFPFQDFVFYAVITAMMGLDRATLKKRLIGSPEILSVIHEKPHLKEFMFSYYNCQYRDWTEHFVEVISHIINDRYFAPNAGHVTRILRLNAYRQFISSYKSVTIRLMADTFGVSPVFIETEVYAFICSGSLKVKIDKVAMVIETIDLRGDQKGVLYKDIIKEGDDLLNKMQKLAAAIER